MLRRCVLELSSSGGSVRRWRGRFAPQARHSIYSRRAFSSAPKPPQGPPRPGDVKPGFSKDTAASGSLFPNILLGAAVVGAAVVVADQAGVIDIGLHSSRDGKSTLRPNNPDNAESPVDVKQTEEAVVLTEKEPGALSNLEANTERNDKVLNVEDLKDNKENVSETSPEPKLATKEENKILTAPQDDLSPLENRITDQGISSEQSAPSENKFTVNEVSSERGTLSEEDVTDTEIQSKGSVDTNNVLTEMEELTDKNNSELPSVNGIKPSSSHDGPVSKESTVMNEKPEEVTEDFKSAAKSSLLKEYSLQDQEAEVSEMSAKKESDSAEVKGNTGDDKIVLDLIQAIHTAEKSQAEKDLREFEEKKRLLKERYEKELRDSRARELMFAEEVAMLDKELNKERAKSAATVKMLQDKAEQTLQAELQRKEEEMNEHLKKAKELAKAEINAAIANEKSFQMEKIAEANLHINALCMAFYARSEEARQSHSVHKLALGTLALEDALSTGLPIQTVIDVLRASIADIKSDRLVNLVLTSLPEETLTSGTDTKLQLNQKFDALKGTLRHYSLIPHGGGGIITHTLASIASSIKIRESNLSGDGIESVISKVDSLLAEDKFSEAADALEVGVSGTEAEGAIQNWVKQARNRAITEQALAVLQSYATSISLT